jgi:uncharacterized protein YneF (UPF0154 family)
VTDSTGSETSPRKVMRAPLWVILVLIALNLVSVMAAPNAFLMIIGLALVGAGIVGMYLTARSEIKRLMASTGSMNSQMAKRMLRESMPIPGWALVALGVGTVWAIVLLIELVGFLIGMLLFVACLALLAGGIFLAYRVAKKRSSS